MSGTFRSLLFAGILLAPAAAPAAQIFAASITPNQVVPPAPSTASGEGIFSLDASNMLAFNITIRDLHGSETEASIHGPAPAGGNADVLFMLPLGNTKTGSVGPLTATQVASLGAGLCYVNIHSSHHGSGEIRGQILKTLPVESNTWGRVKALYRDATR